MATNPFDDASGRFVVLVNEEGQHSLWPARLDQPDGWEQVMGEADKQECAEYIETHWTDLRPRSVVAAMGG